MYSYIKMQAMPLMFLYNNLQNNQMSQDATQTICATPKNCSGPQQREEHISGKTRH